MTVHILLSDLLPLIYDTLVKQHTRKELLPLEREAILQAIINSIRWSVVRCRRAEKKEPSSSSQSLTELNTSDRLCNQWMSRSEIIDRIGHSCGLDQPLPHLALSLMEVRLDLALTANDVSIEGLGEIQLYKEDKSEGPLSNIESTIESTYDTIFKEILSSRRKTSKSLLNIWRPKPASYLTELTELLEMVTAFRQPLPYRIKPSPNLVLSRQTLSQPETMTLQPKEEYRFKWDEEAAFSSKKVLRLLRR